MNEKKIPKMESALQKRCKNHPEHDKINYYNKDCNVAIDGILDAIEIRGTLGLAFIDPTGLNAKFDLLQKIASKKIDIIVNFPLGMAIKRNIQQSYGMDESALDEFVGDRGWRDFATDREFSKYYEGKLKQSGFPFVEAGKMIRNTKNAGLYYLLFATKDKLGAKLWREIHKIEFDGQRKLPGVD